MILDRKSLSSKQLYIIGFAMNKKSAVITAAKVLPLLGSFPGLHQMEKALSSKELNAFLYFKCTTSLFDCVLYLVPIAKSLFLLAMNILSFAAIGVV